jgi:hypothetical protein
MATTNSTANLITFGAAADTARTGQRLKVAGVVVVSASLTAGATVRLQDGAGTLDILPLTKAKSGAGLIYEGHFRPPVEVVGLKATNCTNANIRVYLK